MHFHIWRALFGYIILREKNSLNIFAIHLKPLNVVSRTLITVILLYCERKHENDVRVDGCLCELYLTFLFVVSVFLAPYTDKNRSALAQWALNRRLKNRSSDTSNYPNGIFLILKKIELAFVNPFISLKFQFLLRNTVAQLIRSNKKCVVFRCFGFRSPSTDAINTEVCI